jgi:hypothetical protein
MYVNEKECAKAGKNAETIEQLARHFSSAGRRARKLGVYVFGGSGGGTIRCRDADGGRPLILANIDGEFDGGDGASRPDAEGLERGE